MSVLLNPSASSLENLPLAFGHGQEAQTVMLIAPCRSGR